MLLIVNRTATPKLHLLQSRARQASVPLSRAHRELLLWQAQQASLAQTGLKKERSGRGKLFRIEHECATLNSGEPSNTKRSICAPTSVSEARPSIARYLAFYNWQLPHSSLDDRTPTRLFRRANLGGCRMTDAHDFAAALIGHPLSVPRPNRKPGVRYNAAEIQPAGCCPNKRSQLFSNVTGWDILK
jgi:hypothetical protein